MESEEYMNRKSVKQRVKVSILIIATIIVVGTVDQTVTAKWRKSTHPHYNLPSDI